MSEGRRERRIPSGWLATILVLVVGVSVWASLGAFNGDFTRTVPVTLTADRSGLVMEPYAKVRMRGLAVGQVLTVASQSGNTARLQLEIFSDQIKYIPANVEARINATSVFGAKYVDLIYPEEPSPKRLAAGAVLKSQNVAVEINTVFDNLVEMINQIDPSKLNAILSAFAEGVRGQGERIGQATTDANEVLTALNARTDTIREDFRALAGASDTYSAAAENIVTILDAASTTSVTVADQARQLDALLVNVAGFSRSGVGLLGPSKNNLVRSVESLKATTALLYKYNPSLTCFLVGANVFLEKGGRAALGGNGYALVQDAQILLGADQYDYPQNLPTITAKGGPGGKPSCGSLPDVGNNWPVRYLVANTGWGTGLDMRPNPGIGFPGYANYLPVTRAVPEPPVIRNVGPPAIGPIPYPGAPPYGAPQYGLDGTPLYPGVPPAPVPPNPATPQVAPESVRVGPPPGIPPAPPPP